MIVERNQAIQREVRPNMNIYYSYDEAVSSSTVWWQLVTGCSKW